MKRKSRWAAICALMLLAASAKNSAAALQQSLASELMPLNLQGKPAPAFTLQTLHGERLSLVDYKGKTIVVNFWATDCGPCKLEMPWFQKMQQKYGAQGLVVLGIDQDSGKAKAASPSTVRRMGISYPILYGTAAVSRRYGGVEYLPETFYITRKGTVLLQTVGVSTQADVESKILRTLASVK